MQEIESSETFTRADIRHHYKALKLLFSEEELKAIYEESYKKFMKSVCVTINGLPHNLNKDNIIVILKAAAGTKYTNICLPLDNEHKGVFIAEEKMVSIAKQYLYACECFINAVYTAEVKSRAADSHPLKYEYNFITDENGRVYSLTNNS